MKEICKNELCIYDNNIKKQDDKTTEFNLKA